MAEVAIALTAISTVGEVVGQVQAAQIEERQIRTEEQKEARALEREIDQSMAVGRRARASAIAAFAGSGIDVSTGTPLEILANFERQDLQNALDLGAQSGARRARLANQREAVRTRRNLGLGASLVSGLSGGLQIGNQAGLFDSSASLFTGSQQRRRATSVRESGAFSTAGLIGII